MIKRDLALVALGSLLLGGFKTARSLAVAQVRSLASPERIGLVYGISETTSAIAIMFAPLLAGYLYAIQPERIYATTLVLIGFSILISLLIHPKPTIIPVIQTLGTASED